MNKIAKATILSIGLMSIVGVCMVCGIRQHQTVVPSVTYKSGYIDQTGTFLIKQRFDYADCFSQGWALIRSKDEFAYIDKRGDVVLRLKDKVGSSFHEGLASIAVPVDRPPRDILDSMDSIHGFIDKTGRIVISPRFGHVGYFAEGLAPVQTGGWGFIDKTGKFAIQPQFLEAHSFSQGLACVRFHDGRWGYIDKTGRIIVKPEYVDADSFSDGLAAVQTADLNWAYIDPKGRPVLKLGIESDSRSIVAVRLVNRKAIYVDKSGHSVSHPTMEQWSGEHLAGAFSEGLAPVKAGDKWGYINRSGSYAIKPQFDRAESFAAGLARVCINKKYGYINKAGLFIIKPQFEFCPSGTFSEGLAVVESATP